MSLKILDGPQDTAWMKYANCQGVDPQLFFPERGVPATDIDEAKAVCKGCVVRTACLNYALTNKEMHGIWGGKSERQRRKLRREQAAARKAAA